MSCCCFTGHRVIAREETPSLLTRLDRTLAALYERGVREFRTGGALGFDLIVALRVLHFREAHPDCKLRLILPCRDQAAKWKEQDRLTYEWILEKADEVTVLFESYTPTCMHARNRALVDGSDVCVAFLKRNHGGTLYTYTYAMKKGLELINLAFEDSFTKNF